MTESINLRLKLDSSDVQALMGGGGKSVGMGTIAGGVAGGIGIFSGIKYSLDKLVQSSPQLQGSIMMLQKSLEMTLRPIGDIIGMWIRPLAIKLLKLTMEHKDVATGIGAVLGIGAAVIGVKYLAGLLGMGTTTIAGAEVLSIPVGLALAGIAAGGAIGYLLGGDLKTAIISAAAFYLSLSLATVLGVGTVIAIPYALVFAGVAGELAAEDRAAQERLKKIREEANIYGYPKGVLSDAYGGTLSNQLPPEADAFSKQLEEIGDMSYYATDGVSVLGKMIQERIFDLPSGKQFVVDFILNDPNNFLGQGTGRGGRGNASSFYQQAGGVQTASGGWIFPNKSHADTVTTARLGEGYKDY